MGNRQDVHVEVWFTTWYWRNNLLGRKEQLFWTNGCWHRMPGSFQLCTRFYVKSNFKKIVHIYFLTISISFLDSWCFGIHWMERQSLLEPRAFQCSSMLWTVTWQNYSSETCQLGDMSNCFQKWHGNQGNIQLWLHRWYNYEFDGRSTIFIFNSLFLLMINNDCYFIFKSTWNYWGSSSLPTIRHLELWRTSLCSFVWTASVQGRKCWRK